MSGEVISEEYSLEYGTDKMEMHVGAVEAGERALVIDDLIATGGTLSAAIRLLGTIRRRIFCLRYLLFTLDIHSLPNFNFELHQDCLLSNFYHLHVGWDL